MRAQPRMMTWQNSLRKPIPLKPREKPKKQPEHINFYVKHQQARSTFQSSKSMTNSRDTSVTPESGMSLEKSVESSNDVPVAPRTPLIRSVAKTQETVQATKETVGKSHIRDRDAVKSTESPPREGDNGLALRMIILSIMVETAFIIIVGSSTE